MTHKIPEIGTQLKNFCTGRQYSAHAIASELGQSFKRVMAVLRVNVKYHGTYGVLATHHRQTDTWSFVGLERLVLRVDVTALFKEIQPLLNGLHEEGKKHEATASPPTVRYLTVLLERALKKRLQSPMASERHDLPPVSRNLKNGCRIHSQESRNQANDARAGRADAQHGSFTD